MKKILFPILFLCISYSTKAQYAITHQVVGSTGFDGNAAALRVNSTLGELATPTLSNQTIMLSQGFHQDDKLLVSASTNGPSALQGYTLLPNPTAGMLRLQHDTPFSADVWFQLMDVSGRLLYAGMLPRGQNSKDFDLHGQAAGTYFLTLYTPDARTIFQIIKL